jgi:hypothetical protein
VASELRLLNNEHRRSVGVVVALADDEQRSMT